MSKRIDIMKDLENGMKISECAKKYNVSVNSLVQKNGIKDPNLIYVGQRIEI